MNIFNPFGITGWEAMLTTGIVCLTVYACVRMMVTATVQTASVICQACETFSHAVADALVAVFTGKPK